MKTWHWIVAGAAAVGGLLWWKNRVGNVMQYKVTAHNKAAGIPVSILRHTKEEAEAVFSDWASKGNLSDVSLYAAGVLIKKAN